MAKVSVSGKVEPGLKQTLKAIGAATGKSESELVREAVAQFLGQTSLDSVRSLVQRVSTLEHQYQQLVEQMLTERNGMRSQ